MKNIALLTWWTKEREISLKSAESVKNHLTKEHKVDVFVLPEDIHSFIKNYQKYDITIPISHWAYIEDGRIIGLLEIMEKPFLFSGAEAHSICMNKYLTNMIAKDLWLRTPEHFLIQQINDIPACKIKGKVFVKPNHWWSSIDIGIFKNIDEGKKLIQEILQYDDVIIQKAIIWREFTVSIIGDYDKKIIPIAVTEIVTTRDFFDFKAKYERAETKEITPAKIDKKMKKELERMSISIYKRLKLRTLSRIDFMYSKGKFYFLEANSIPGLTGESLVPQALTYYGYESLGEFLEESMRNI